MQLRVRGRSQTVLKLFALESGKGQEIGGKSASTGRRKKKRDEMDDGTIKWGGRNREDLGILMRFILS